MRPRTVTGMTVSVVLVIGSFGLWLLDLAPLVFCLFFGAIGALTFVESLLGPVLQSVFGFGRLDPSKLNRAVDKYEANAKPCAFLLRDDRPLAEPPPDWPESDIYDYGVEGILIVGRPLLVDLFVLNGFHTENRMLVVSECGYPDYLVPHANRIVSEQPDVPVYVLHDSTPNGTQMARRLTVSRIFDLQGHAITDLGLGPDDVNRMRHLKKFAAGGSVEIDHLRWNRLCNGAAAAIVGGSTLVNVIDADPDGSRLSFG